jgi:hypothetical protein
MKKTMVRSAAKIILNMNLITTDKLVLTIIFIFSCGSKDKLTIEFIAERAGLTCFMTNIVLESLIGKGHVTPVAVEKRGKRYVHYGLSASILSTFEDELAD